MFPSSPDHAIRPRTATRRVALVVVAALALVAAACGSDGSGAEGEASSTSPSAQLASAAQLGSFAVGQRTIDIADAQDPARTMSVDVWYPVEADAVAGATPTEYAFLPGLGYTSERSFASAPPAQGPFPLVIYSHGSGGFRWVATFFTEFLASHGFVVAAPDHTGNTAIDGFTGTATDSATTAYNRPRDVTTTIDAVLALSEDDADPLAGRVDAERIAVAGHSFGGFTTLAMASGYDAEAGPVPSDPRVKALVAMAPYTLLFSDTELGFVDVPTLIVSGTEDERTPIADNTERPANLIAGRPLVRVDITGAAHNSFTDLCFLADAVGQLPDVPQAIVDELASQTGQACGDEVLAWARVHEINNAYSLAFLTDVLLDTDTYAAVLSCEGAPPEVVCTSKS